MAEVAERRTPWNEVEVTLVGALEVLVDVGARMVRVVCPDEEGLAY